MNPLTSWIITTAPPLTFAAPLLIAAGLGMSSGRLPRWLLDGLATATSATVAIFCAALTFLSASARIVYSFGGWRPTGGVSLGVLFVIDPLGAGLATLAAVLVTASLVFSWRYFRAVKELYHVLMLVFLGAMVGFCLSGDIFNLFVFFELMGVAAYALTGYMVEEGGPLQGALNFAISNSVGAFLILFGIGLLYARTGALNMAQIGRALAGKPADALVVMSFSLITAGFLVKAAVVPFHFWLPDAHAVAPSPVCALFSGVMVELGLYAIARLYWTVFAGALAPHADIVRAPLMALGALTALLGAVMAILQRHIKRLLAFSTISHVGVFLLGFALFTPLGLAGSAIYVLGHGLAKGALFLGCGILLHQFHDIDENRLRGRGKSLPLVALIFFAGALEMASLAPFTTFWGKTALEASAVEHGLLWMTGVMVFSSALSGGATLRAAGSVFLGWGRSTSEDMTAATMGKEKESESGGPSARPPVVMLAPALVLLAGALFIGLDPALLRGIDLAATHFTDQRAYIAAVLGPRYSAGASAGPLKPVAFDVSALVSSLISTVGAIAYALLALFAYRAPAPLRQAGARLVAAPTAWLRGLQSGHVGDYVTWIVAGAALLSVVYVVALR